jgi:Flp pilus assembly protein TadG
MMVKPMRFLRKRYQRGTSVVEMAIVLPLLLTLIFAIGEFGMMYTQWQTLTNAAREGARVGVVWRGTNCVQATVETEIQNAVSQYMAHTGVPTAAINTTTTGVCTGAGTQLRVTAQVPYSFAALPFLAGLQSSINLGTSSTMRNE